MTEHYDAIFVGTSFASSFFLKRYLEQAPKTYRILVLERGNSDTKAWQLANRKTSSIPVTETFINKQPEKEWLVSPGFGGNSKCWWGGAARMMPGDFQLRTRYGVGYDWPMTYDELEPYYGQAENIMKVSGPSDSPMPRSQPFQLPPHIFSDPEVLLKKAFPSGWYHPATVRATAPTGTRGICCASGICELCPQDAKFTIQNGLAYLYDDPRVTLLLQAEAKEVLKQGNIATGIKYARHGKILMATADLVILGANAIFNPFILLRSGITHPLLGKRLHEQMPVDVCMNLHDVKAYNGSTSISGNGYLFYEGEHRSKYAACLIETWNSPFNYRRAALRTENGRWTERTYMRFMFDEIPQDDNTVTISKENPDMPETNFKGYSDYAKRGMAQIPRMVEALAKVLPIEGIESMSVGRTTAHIQGTAVMGNDPATSVVDPYLVHHQIRNLLVLGASSYPTASPTYPTLTLSALSLWAADHLMKRGVKHA